MQQLKSKLYKLLRWSEKYTKTDMVYLASGGFWLMGGSMVSSFLGFISVIAFAKLLPQETFGIYKYVLSFIAIIAIPSLPGINTALTKAVANKKDGTCDYAVKLKLKWGLLSTIFAISIGIYYNIKGNDLMSILFFITAFFIPIIESFGIYTNILQGKKHFKTISKYEILSSIILTTIMLTTLFITKNIFILMTFYLIGLSFTRLIFSILTNKKITKLNNDIDKDLLSYGKHLTLMGIFGTISSSIDKILLWHFFGPLQIAIYFISVSVPLQINGLLKIINRIAFPKLAIMDVYLIKKTLLKKIMKISTITIPIIILYYLYADVFFLTFFPQYIESIAYSKILIWMILLQPISIIGTMFNSKAKKKELYIINIIPQIFFIIFSLIMVPTLGIMGAVISMLLSRITYSILAIYLYIKI